MTFQVPFLKNSIQTVQHYLNPYFQFLSTNTQQKKHIAVHPTQTPSKTMGESKEHILLNHLNKTNLSRPGSPYFHTRTIGFIRRKQGIKTCLFGNSWPGLQCGQRSETLWPGRWLPLFCWFELFKPHKTCNLF